MSEEIEIIDIYQPETIEDLGKRVSILESNTFPQGSVVNKNITSGLASTQFQKGAKGWILNDNGDAEFNNGVFRGSLAASTIDIGGSDATSFHVDINGNMWLGAATFASAPAKISNTGSLTATAGAIGGWVIEPTAINSASGTGQRMSLSSSDNLITFYNASNAVVSQVGAGSLILSAFRATLDTSTTIGFRATTAQANDIGFEFVHDGNSRATGVNLQIRGTTTNTSIGINVNNDANGGESIYIDNSGGAIGVSIQNVGSGDSLTIASSASRSIFIDHSSNSHIGLEMNYAGTTYGMKLLGTDVDTTVALLYASAAPSGAGVPIVQLVRTNPGNSILSIKSDISTSTNHAGLEIDLNASTTTTPHAFSFLNDCFVSAAVGGTQDRKIRVFIGGATYFIPAYDA